MFFGSLCYAVEFYSMVISVILTFPLNDAIILTCSIGHFNKHRGVAQPGSALRLGRRSRRFESSRPDSQHEFSTRE